MKTKLILDPGLFEVAAISSKDHQAIHFNYLLKSLKFIDSHLDAALDQYNGAPYCYFYDDAGDYRGAPITKSLTVKTNYASIHKILLRMIRNGNLINIPTPEQRVSCALEFEADTISEIPFKCYLQHISKSTEYTYGETLMILSQKNKNHAPELQISSGGRQYFIIAVGDPATDCNGVLSGYLIDNETLHKIFPQEHACTELNSEFLSELKTGCENQRSLFLKYGKEVASRNKYTMRADLSRKNPNYTVFTHPREEYYISIDLLHGGLEVFKLGANNPPHKGEYDFSCKLRKEADSQSHKLIV